MASKCALFIDRFRYNSDKVGRVKRPMNAFLIFCKRQRGCVRRKFPTLENREVTRVLGEWWASLGTADKSIYSALANQQKENLIKNHPELKWHKAKMPGGKVKKPADFSQTGIIPGKLADESQLGGLSSLLQLDKDVVIREEIKPPVPKPLKKRYRDQIYTIEKIEPVPIVEKKIEIEEEPPLDRPSSEVNEEEEERLKIWRSHILEENNNVKETRARACKGQRYREFMWTTIANRRKANRWELNQDKIEPPPVKKIKTAKNDTSKHVPIKISNVSSSDEKSDSMSATETESLNAKKKKIKGNLPNDDKETNLPNNNNNPSLISNNVDATNSPLKRSTNADGKSCDTLTLRNKSDNISSDTVSKKSGGEDDGLAKKIEAPVVIGSRKRKVRKQEIRRLPPGEIINGVSPVILNDLEQAF